jgi:ABC-type transport system substrate-binding protein
MPRLPALLLAAVVAIAQPPAAEAADPQKVLRIAFPDVALLDPQQLTDLYSARVVAAVFEGLYEYQYLSDPARIVPNIAEGMPELTEGGRVWTIRVKRGIRFADHPAFGGKPRELTAHDYVYSLKRWLDPTLKAGGEARLTDLLVGARAVVDAARTPGGRFDYAAPIAGLRAVDAYTLRLELREVDYTILEVLARVQAYAVAREVVEASGGDLNAHPVGTGPYRVAEWKRGSRLVLEAVPGYRAVTFPPVDNPALKPLAASMAGAQLPAIGRIELAIIEEEVPEILAFEQGDLDYALLTGAGARRLLQGEEVRPDLARRGVRHVRYSVPALIYTYFNMDDAVVGGTAPERIALRRAIGMGFNTPEMIRVLYGGDAIPAAQLLPPGVTAHDPSIPPRSSYDPASARALLERFGYRDRDGDGYRERPDGSPLVLSRATTTDSFAREADNLWLASMKAIGLRMEVQAAPFAELLKRSLAGQLPMFNLGYRADSASGYSSMATLWGKAPPDTNRARFRNADFDAAFEAFLRTPPGPQRMALARKMSDIVQVQAPIVYHVYPQAHAFAHPWLRGFHPSAFGSAWKHLDIDVKAKAAVAKR